MSAPTPPAFHAYLSRRYAEYTATTRAMYCPDCGYTGTFKLISGAWWHRPSMRDLQCSYSKPAQS